MSKRDYFIHKNNIFVIVVANLWLHCYLNRRKNKKNTWFKLSIYSTVLVHLIVTYQQEYSRPPTHQEDTVKKIHREL